MVESGGCGEPWEPCSPPSDLGGHAVQAEKAVSFSLPSFVVLQRLHLPFCPWGSFSRSLPPPVAQKHTLKPGQLLPWWLCTGNGRRKEQSHQGGAASGFSTFPFQPSPASPRLPFLSLCTAASLSQIVGLFPSSLHEMGAYLAVPQGICPVQSTSAGWTCGWSHH